MMGRPGSDSAPPRNIGALADAAGLNVEAVRILHQAATAEAPVFTKPLDNNRTAWPLLMCGIELWTKFGSSLPRSDLEAIIRGLVVYSKSTGWSGGSVSPVIALFRVYQERFPRFERRLADWILANRSNAYEPYGSARCGEARSREEYEKCLQLLSERAADKQASERERRNAAAREKSKKATNRLRNAVRRGDVAAVDGLLLQGADWRAAIAAGGSLLETARENQRDQMVEHLRSIGIEQDL